MDVILQVTFSISFLFYVNLLNLTQIWLNFIPKGPINNNPALVQIMAWHQSDDKPLSEQMMAWFTDPYICPLEI